LSEINKTSASEIVHISKAVRQKEAAVMLLMLAALVVVVLISFTIGRYRISLSQVADLIKEAISGNDLSKASREAWVILSVIRIPRIFLSVMVGAALSASGASFQGLFKNPMVSPDILGVSSAAGAGAALAILLNLSSLGVNLMAFLFGTGAVLLVIQLARIVSRGNSVLLIMVLSGIVVSSIFKALTSLTKYIADSENKLPEITFWLMGSFAKSNSSRNILIMFIALVIGSVPLLVLRRRINLLSFGEEEARAMGINTKHMRAVIIACSTVLTATSVCLCGSIEWTGLIMPHMIRLVVGPNYRILLPASMLGGALFMVIVDNFCRAIIPGELPVGIVTSLIGAPLFVYLMFKGRRDWT